MDRIAYRPQNVRESLVELKNTSELAVDLGYAAVLYDFPGLAEEVLELEMRADSLQYPAKIALMLAAKRSSDAEQLVGIIQIVEAAVSITQAAGDIAGIVMNDIGIPAEVRASLPDADEVILRATVSETSAVVGQTLSQLAFESENGVTVTAIRREKEWNIAPAEDTTLAAGDIVIGNGSKDGLEIVYERLTGKSEILGVYTDSRTRSLERAATISIELKNISELAVGLSYAAVLFEDADLATEVQELEAHSDRLKNEIETLVIEAGEHVENPSRLRGLLHLATASEAICDAAVSIAEIVLRDGSVHPVFGQAIGESDELITRVAVTTDSTLTTATLEALELEENTGMSILAIHRTEDWLFAPTGDTQLEAGDTVIARGPKEGLLQLQEWAQA